MKKSILILAAATSVIFAACGGNSAEGEYSQAQLDSIKQASVDSATNAIKAQNDSTLAAEAAAAARTADSLRVIDSVFNAGNKTTTTKTTTTKNSGKGGTTTTKTETKVEPKAEPKPVVRTAEDIKKDKKAAEFGDNSAKARLEQDKKDKKAAEFGDKGAQQRLNETKASKKESEFK